MSLKNKKLFIEIEGRNINLSLSSIEIDIYSRKKSVKIYGENINILNLESIIIYKLISLESQDIVDLELIFKTKSKIIDLEYIEKSLLFRGLKENDFPIIIFRKFVKLFIEKRIN